MLSSKKTCVDGLLAAGLRGGQLLNAKIASFSSLKIVSAERRAKLLLLVVVKEEVCHILIVTALLSFVIKASGQSWIK